MKIDDLTSVPTTPMCRYQRTLVAFKWLSNQLRSVVVSV